MNVIIYSFEVCPYCEQAKALLNGLGVEFEERKVSRDELSDLASKTGMYTVPQIFVGETLIGGFTDLQAKVSDGSFQQLIK